MVDAIDATQSRGCILNDHEILRTDNVHGFPMGMCIINVYPQRRFSISEISDHGSRGISFWNSDKIHDETCHKMCGDRRDNEQMWTTNHKISSSSVIWLNAITSSSSLPIFRCGISIFTANSFLGATCFWCSNICSCGRHQHCPNRETGSEITSQRWSPGVAQVASTQGARERHQSVLG